VLNMDCLHLFDADTGEALLQQEPVC
jgi:hypothetical protein